MNNRNGKNKDYSAKSGSGESSAEAMEALLDVERSAYLLGISVKTLRDWTRKRKIEYVKSGARVMIRPEAIRDFIARNTHKAAE